MAKNDVQLLQEIVDKLGGQLDASRVLTQSSLDTAVILQASADVLMQANDTLARQLGYMRPVNSGNPYSVTAIAATAAQPDLFLIPDNPERRGGTIFNDSAAIMYLLLGLKTATSSFYTVQVPPNGYYELPFMYSGPVRAVWASATGNARVTEYTL